MDIDDYTIIAGLPRHARPQGLLRPFDQGWALDAAGVLAAVHPQFLLHSFGASPRWRQAVFLAFAHGVLPQPEEFLLRATGTVALDRPWKAVQQDLAVCLMRMTSKQIVQATLGEIPEGLAGCIGRLGSQSMRHAGDYLRLVKLLRATDREGKLRAKTLLQLDRLDADLISAVEQVDAIALIPTILRRVRDGLEARRLNQRLAAIRLVCSTATEEALRQSLEDRAANFRGHDFAQAWLERADRPPVLCPEVCSHPEFERVTPATAADVGRTHSNCLGARAHRLVSGIWGAWVWKPGPLIATITRCEEGDLLTGVYAPGNREVSPDLARRLKSVLRELGVICFTRVDPPDNTRLLTIGRFEDFDLDELDLA